MPENFIIYFGQYGYLAIFIFLFLQEIGFPSPLPNEFILLFCGYLIFSDILKPLYLVLIVVSSDLLAAALLYFVFFLFGKSLLVKKNKWMPISQKNIQKLTQRIVKFGYKGIFLGRLSPFIRGYVSAISGFIRIDAKGYAITILISSTIRGIMLITGGYLLGPYWEYVNKNIEKFKYFLIVIPICIVVWMSIKLIVNYINRKQVPNSVKA